MVILKELFLTVSTLGRCGGLERTDFLKFLLFEGVVFWLSQLADLVQWINLINFKKLNHSLKHVDFSFCLSTLYMTLRSGFSLTE